MYIVVINCLHLNEFNIIGVLFDHKANLRLCVLMNACELVNFNL